MHDGKLYVADTYNNKIKVIDPQDEMCTTLAGTGKPGAADEPAQFDEPAGLAYAAGKLYVADTNNHLIRTIDLKTKPVRTLEIKGLNPPAPPRPKQAQLPSGARRSPCPRCGQADGRQAPSGSVAETAGRLEDQCRGAAALSDRGGRRRRACRSKSLGQLSPVLRRRRSFDRFAADQKSGQETLKVSLAYYYCQEGDSGLCKAGSVVWTVPIKVAADAQTDTVPLVHKVE